MSKTYYMPKDDSGKAELLEHLASRLPAHATTLELSEADIRDVQADAVAFRNVITTATMIQSNARQWTAFKNLLRDGGAGSNALPPAPSPVDPVPAVALGIVPRLAGLVVRIKAARNYTDAIGQDLNIVGTAQAVDTDDLKPVIDIAIKAGQPAILWSKGDADTLEIWVDRGDDKGFGLFTIASSPRVPDPTPLPASPVHWKYKAIYRLKDAQIGNWSTITPVAVGG